MPVKTEMPGKTAMPVKTEIPGKTAMPGKKEISGNTGIKSTMPGINRKKHNAKHPYPHHNSPHYTSKQKNSPSI
ncbi:hypothetical protein [Bacillus sp. SJS]|uniref:hypothetical protein n=1 Tax=Bacillus sp. SJS TaxID=1423321 RepID=UPI0012E7A0BE|nr:hypothetical protein [Bacillus sp. SJS]